MSAPRTATPTVTFLTEAGRVTFGAVHGRIEMVERVEGRFRSNRTTPYAPAEVRTKLNELLALIDIAEQQAGG